MDQILWQSKSSELESSHIQKFLNHLALKKNLHFDDYEALWQWSVESGDAFWEILFHYFPLKYEGQYQSVTDGAPMPYTRWFEGVKLNYAEHILSGAADDQSAIIAYAEGEEPLTMDYGTLRRQVASFQTFLKSQGVGEGDRVVAYTTNTPHAIVACLATLSLGAIWSSCSPDFGLDSVVERFEQIQPKVMIAVEGYRYNGKPFDKREVIQRIAQRLPSLQKLVQIPYLEQPFSPLIHHAVAWEQTLSGPFEPLHFTRVPFDHPIWILYSSGTTGKPKAITHRHGGMLLEHFKYLAFHNDVREGEKFFWFSTAGWMMWNFALSSLLLKATLVLYEGSPSYPDLQVLWKMASACDIQHFGTSAPFVVACMKNQVKPNQHLTFSSLRSIGSTGSPLPAEGYAYLYNHVASDLWLCSMSGGTDVCTAFVGGTLLKPVEIGKIQARTLGCSLYAYNDRGESVEGELGEMVVTQPMPCMPLCFWGDLSFEKYKEAYFEYFPNLWRHGDWITLDNKGMLIIHGRSDATLNRQGVRIGTGEIYAALHKIPEIEDGLIINLELEGGRHFMPLFVKMKEGLLLHRELELGIKALLKRDCSPRHVPDAIFQIPDIPSTLSGKKMEAPVKKILMNFNPQKSYSPDAMRNPESMDYFLHHKEDILNAISK
jgi:acetoacetyl-CoA synthetase